MHSVIYSTVNRIVHTMSLPTMIIVWCVALVVFIAYRSRRL